MEGGEGWREGKDEGRGRMEQHCLPMSKVC